MFRYDKSYVKVNEPSHAKFLIHTRMIIIRQKVKKQYGYFWQDRSDRLIQFLNR